MSESESGISLSPSRKRKLLIVVIVLLFITLSMGCFGISWYLDSTKYVTTEDARVWSDTVAVSSKIAGKLKTLSIKQGDVVKKDRVIAKLDSADLELALNQAKANLEMATVRQKQAQEALDLQILSTSSQVKQAYNNLEISKTRLAEANKGSRPEEISIAEEKVNQAKINLDKAKDTLKRNAPLYQEGAVSEVQYKQYNDEVTIAEKSYNQELESLSLAKQGLREEEKTILKKQIAQAEAGFELASAGDRQSKLKMYDLKVAEIAAKQAEYAVAQANLNYSNSYIKSPCDGIIEVKSINEGEMVSPGQALFSIINLEKTWVATNIKETEVGKIKVGSKVELFVDADKGKKFDGEVYEIGNATNAVFSIMPSFNTSGNFTKVTQLIPLRIKIINGGKTFKVGSSVKIKIKTQKLEVIR